MQADIAVLDSNGRAVLLVEAKAKTGTSRRWAAEFRRNLAAHGLLPSASYFILATPDHVYLWKGPPNVAEAVEPDYDIDAQAVFASYFEKLELGPNEAKGRSFELLVAGWLSDLQRVDTERVGPQKNGWLVESGLLRALQGGKVVVDTSI